MDKLDVLIGALRRPNALKEYVPEDREAAATKIRRLRELRLAQEQKKPRRRSRR